MRIERSVPHVRCSPAHTLAVRCTESGWVWIRLLESHEIASQSTPVSVRKAREMLLPSHQECPVICDPSNGAKRAGRRVASRLIPFVVAAGGLLMALSGVSDAKPPTLPDLRKKTVPTKKPAPGPTPRPVRPVVRPKPTPRGSAKTTVSRRVPVLARHLGGTRLSLGGVEVEFAEIPAGEFMMGMDRVEIDETWKRFGWDEDWKTSATYEGPMHRVKVSGFEFGVTEVTVGQFRAYCRAIGKGMPAQEEWNDTATHPVHNVTGEDVVGFCEWATSELKRQRLPGWVRLPTEAEWEYAARGGDTGLKGRARKVFVWGDDLPRTGAPVGNLPDARTGALNSNFSVFPNYDDGYARTAPVGRFPANPYGLRDLAGNVWEWCQDRDTGGTPGVLRGGSWCPLPCFLRVSSRYGMDPDYRSDSFGFRLARTPTP